MAKLVTTKLVTTRQLELLLEFMEQHRSLALGRVRGKEGSALSKKLWSQCAAVLNADFKGPYKSIQEWKKYYNQYKSRAKAKLRSIKEGQTIGGGPAEGASLSPLEERLIGILGGCSSPLPVRPNSLDALPFDPATEGGNNDGGEGSGDAGDSDDDGMHDAAANEPDLLSVKQENLEYEVVLQDAASPPNCTAECNEAVTTRKRPLRANNERPMKRRLHHRWASPKVNNEFEAAGQRLAAIEQSRIEVDRELAQAIHRHASAMESIAGSVNRFVDLYERNLQQASRSENEHMDKQKRQ